MNHPQRSPVYLAKRRRARGALLVCVVLLFIGYAYLTVLEAFLSPLLVGGGTRLYLLYGSHSAREPEPSFYLRERGPDGLWRAERRFQGEFQAAAGVADELWVFYRRSCSVYRDGVQVSALAVEVPWDVLAAVAAPDATGEARAFLVWGFDSTHALRGARLEAEAGAARGGRWRELPVSLARSSTPRHVSAVAHGAAVLLAWPRNTRMPEPAPSAGAEGAADAGGDPWTLEALQYDGTRLVALAPLPLGETAAFGLLALEGTAALVTVPDDHKEATTLRLSCRRFDGERWGAPADFRIADRRWGFGRRVLSLTGWIQGGQAHLVVSRAAGLEYSSAPIDALRGGSFPRLEPVSPTASFGRPEVFVWLISLLFLALLLVFLGVSLLTERFRPAAPRPEGSVPVEVASWLQRAIAWGVDLCVLSPAVMLLLWACGYDAEAMGRLEGGPLMLVTVLWDAVIVLYATALEARSGQTLGKRIMRIHVLTEEGGKPSFRQALLRNLIRPLDAFGPQVLIGLLFILATRQAQRLGDLLARTVVARHGPRWTA